MNYCLIPFRFYSQRLARKNYKDVFGLKLNSITISQAIGSGIFDKIIIAVDDLHEVDENISLPPNISIYTRDPRNSDAESSLESLLKEVIDVFEFEPDNWVTVLQVTNPLRKKRYFDLLQNAQRKAQHSSITSVVGSKRFSYSEVIEPNFVRSNTQNKTPRFLETGSFWSFKVEEFQKSGHRNPSPNLPIEIDVEDDFDIDDIDDFEIFRALHLKRITCDNWYRQNIEKLSTVYKHFFEHFKNHVDMLFKIEPDLIDEVNSVGCKIRSSIQMGGKVIFFGNGGSAADSQHLATEFISKLKNDRSPLPALALTTDTSALTAISNDYGAEHIFSRQVAALVKAEDVVIGITTSGNSINVLNGLEQAKALGATTVLMTSIRYENMSHEFDFCLRVPSEDTAAIQELHIFLGHILVAIGEQTDAS